ncbi:MAG: hypothetical protein R6X05_00005, partial [Desulfobacterales bacterium]
MLTANTQWNPVHYAKSDQRVPRHQPACSGPENQTHRQTVAPGLAITSISITKPADKLVYGVGEPLDLSGLEVT